MFLQGLPIFMFKKHLGVVESKFQPLPFKSLPNKALSSNLSKPRSDCVLCHVKLPARPLRVLLGDVPGEVEVRRMQNAYPYLPAMSRRV